MYGKRIFHFSFSMIYCLISILIVLLGCGGGGGGGGNETINIDNDNNIKEGIFIDSAVEGIEYSTTSLDGITDSNGKFKFREGETVEFSIGNIQIGQVEGRDLITPYDFLNDIVSYSHPKIINLPARRLNIHPRIILLLMHWWHHEQ